MKRKGLLFVALTILICMLSLCFFACNEEPHVHDYKIEKSETMHWLKCDCGDTKDFNVHGGGIATCVEKAECSVCGETYGELGEHNYGEWKTNYNSTHSKVCINEASHVITENCSGGTATEEERATCEVCNGKYGSSLNHTHNFNKQEVKETYLKSKATCEERAVYYYSCSCGAVGTETFEYGEVISCNYLEGVCEWCSKPNPSSTEGLTFTLINNDLEYEVSGYNGFSTEVYIASTHNGKPITSIGSSAFSGCDSLTSVTIGNSVTSIGYDAFYDCTSLTSVTIPDSVTSIGKYAFSGCISLKSVTIGNSVTSIGKGAFSGCNSLKSVTIPDSVTSIGYRAFYGCNSLRSVTFSDTSTWYITSDYSEWVNKTGGTEFDVTDASNNAWYFKLEYYWYKI